MQTEAAVAIAIRVPKNIDIKIKNPKLESNFLSLKWPFVDPVKAFSASSRESGAAAAAVHKSRIEQKKQMNYTQNSCKVRKTRSFRRKQSPKRR